MTHSRRLILSISTVLLSGCVSAPVHYYTLTRPVAPADENGTAVGYQVKVTRVLIPPQVDRSELVIRQGDDEVRVLSNQLWLSSLKDEVRSALNVEVTAKLSDAKEASDHVTEKYTVLVDITRFETVPGEYVLISADSQIKNVTHPNNTFDHCTMVARVPVQRAISAVVRAYQSALQEIADTIVLAVVEQGQATPRGCVVGLSQSSKTGN